MSTQVSLLVRGTATAGSGRKATSPRKKTRWVLRSAVGAGAGASMVQPQSDPLHSAGESAVPVFAALWLQQQDFDVSVLWHEAPSGAGTNASRLSLAPPQTNALAGSPPMVKTRARISGSATHQRWCLSDCIGTLASTIREHQTWLSIPLGGISVNPWAGFKPLFNTDAPRVRLYAGAWGARARLRPFTP